MSWSSERGQLLREANVIIWDEMAMSHAENADCADALLSDLRSAPGHFGGATVLGCGDFHQLPPVVTDVGDDIGAVLRVCIFNCRSWKYFSIHELKEPQRDFGDLHSAFVDKVGRAIGQTEMELENIRTTNDIDGLINHVYPQDQAWTLQEPGRAILTTHTTSVEEINERIMETRLTSQQEVLYSTDTHEEDEAQIQLTTLPDTPGFHDVENLNSITSPGQMPPHKLILKRGATAIVMRNTSPHWGERGQLIL